MAGLATQGTSGTHGMNLVGSKERVMEKRRRYDTLLAEMDSERSSFRTHWKDLNDYILPRRGRFFLSDVNKGDRRNLNIVDSTATLAVRTLGAGMMSGITSPSRPWFKLTTREQGSSEEKPVRDWLAQVESTMRSVFLKSNLYNVLPLMYADMAVFGTACVYMEESFDEVVRFYSFPIGSYMLAKDDKGRVSTFAREFRMTVDQVVNKWGRKGDGDKGIDWSNISTQVHDLYMTNQKAAWVDICHVVKRNDMYNPKRLESKFKKYSSDYYEKGISSTRSSSASISSSETDRFLSEKGMDFFPILAPRWEVTGEDIYGTNCPGMVGLGDIKQLQLGEKRSAEAIEKQVRPPMVGPTSLRQTHASILPGDITYVDEREGAAGFRPVHEVRFDINALEAKQAQIRQRISRSFYEDLFLMLANSDRRQITAREIDERHEEKLLAVGPVLEQINQDVLDPLIDNTFDLMAEQGMIPEAPEQLRGQPLKVEYISIMAQAQKLTGIGAIERTTGFVGQLAQFDPSAVKKLNINEVIDEYGDLAGAPVKMLRTNEEVAEIEAQEQQAIAAQQAAEQAQVQAQTAKTLSETSTEDGSALSALAEEQAL